jgi:hypothetical protein
MTDVYGPAEATWPDAEDAIFAVMNAAQTYGPDSAEVIEADGQARETEAAYQRAMAREIEAGS